MDRTKLIESGDQLFAGFRVVTVPGLPDDRVMMLSFDGGSPHGDECAAVSMAHQTDGKWRVDAMVSGDEAKAALLAALLRAEG